MECTLKHRIHQTNLFGTDLLQQLDSCDPLLQLAKVIPWADLPNRLSDDFPETERGFE